MKIDMVRMSICLMEMMFHLGTFSSPSIGEKDI